MVFFLGRFNHPGAEMGGGGLKFELDFAKVTGKKWGPMMIVMGCVMLA